MKNPIDIIQRRYPASTTYFSITVFMFFFCFTSFAFSEDCRECHFIPDDSSHLLHSSPDILKPAYGDTGFTFNYLKKSDKYGFNCGNCHPLDISKHRNGDLDIELYSRSSSGLKKLNSKNASFDKEKRTCNGVYCHSSGGDKNSLTYIETPAWESSFKELRCQGCHGSPPSYPNENGRKNSHFNPEKGSAHLLGIHWDSAKGHTKESFSKKRSSDMGCSTCHNSTVSRDTDTSFIDNASGLFTCSRCHEDKTVMGRDRTGTISNKALHVNGIVEVSFTTATFRTTAQMISVPHGWQRTGKKGDGSGFDETITGLNSATYAPNEKKCLNVACHLLGKEVKWGDEADCDACHLNFIPAK